MLLKKLILIVGVAMIPGAVHAQDTLSYWGFNETAGTTTKEAIANTAYAINTKWPVIERVPGIRQNALRSDGYTFFVEGTTPVAYPVDSFSVSLWVALETHPVSTAAIWSYFDPAVNRGAAVTITKFGQVTVRLTINGQAVLLTSTSRVEHYKWSFIVVNVDAVNGNCTVYVNGTEILNQKVLTGSLNWPTTKIYLGRSAATEMQDIFPLNYINGIYDEIIVRKRRLAPSQIIQEYNALKPATAPDLATPATRFAGDFHRPKYHPVPQSGWANESHGLLYYNGVYHMFFQKNGNGPFFSQQNWGHLVSTDLVHWQEKQVALFPQPGWESVGTWSGHAVLDNAGIPTIIYTGVDGVKAGIGSAQSTGDLLVWNRHLSNPLIPAAPTAYPNRDFRDPYVFKEGSTWYMIVGSGLQNPSTGTVFLYKSPDLATWQFVKPLFIDQSGLNNVGIFWEMPVFWKFGNRYMLLVNKTPQGATPARAFYWVGDFVNESYNVTNLQAKNLDIINSLLSPAVNLDAQNQVTAIGIIPDLLPGSEQYQNGWANVFSLPRVWQMQHDSLFQSPHPNLNAGRGQATTFSNLSVKPDSSGYLKLRGFQAEIKATITPGTASKVGFVLEKSADNMEFTKIYYDYTGQSFVVDRTKSSTNPNTPRDFQAEFFPLPAGQPVDWHIYIDGSVIEVFINNKWAFATRVYPANSSSNIIDLFAEGGTATANTVQVWNRGDVDVVTGIFGPSAPAYQPLKTWPLPANTTCYIQLPTTAWGKTRLEVYDMNGRLVRQTEQPLTASKIIEWNLKDGNGKKVPSGNYQCRVFVNRNDLYQVKIVVVP